MYILIVLLFISSSMLYEQYIRLSFAEFVVTGVTVENIPQQNYTPSMFWLRQYATVMDLFISTFEYHRFHHELINAIDGYM